MIRSENWQRRFKACFQAMALVMAVAWANAGYSQPNILVIMTDDQGVAQMDPFISGGRSTEEQDRKITSVFSGEEKPIALAAAASMPHLRQLAGEGLRFSDASVPLPVCSPSRAGFITARYPQRHGTYSNDDIALSGIDVEESFLSEVLQEHGYATAIIGKWHLGEYRREALATDSVDYHRWNRVSMRDEDHPLNRGFDYYFGFTASGSNFYNPSSLFRNFEPVEESEYLTDAFTREALAFISNRPVEKPFFVFLSYNAPHIPVYEPAPAKYLNRFDTGNAAVDNYYAKLNAVDEGIHQIRALLEARGEWDNTFVVYFSDNGAVADSPHPRNAPLRGFKGKLEQGGIRVPMVWRLPGSLAQAAGTLVEEPVSSMDILPTALALAGLEEASGQKIDGVNLLPFLVENKPWPAQRRLFYAGSHASHWSIDNLPFWQSYQQYLAEGDRSAPHPESEMIEKHGPGGLSVRHGRWWMRWDGDSGEFQLFDMSNDIGESHDLAAVHPEKVIDLKKQISAWLAPLPPPNHWNKSYWKAMRKAVGLSPE